MVNAIKIVIESSSEIVNLLRKTNNNLNTVEGRANERHRRILLTALTAGLAKLISMCVPLITVRISLAYLGSDVYGLWMAVTSLFSLMSFADLGLANGLQTRLSRVDTVAEPERAQSIISNAFAMLTVVAFAILIVFSVAYWYVDWRVLLNAQSSQTRALSAGIVAAIFIPKIINVPLSLVQRTQLALQEGYKSNIWNSVAGLLSLISVFIIAHQDAGRITLILVSSSIPPLVSLANNLYYFGLKMRKIRPNVRAINKNVIENLLRTGVAFLILRVFTTIGLSLDNFVVARTASLDQVSTYSILARTTQLINVAAVMFSMPLWSANGEALAKGDYKWVKITTKRMSNICVIITALSSMFLIVFGSTIFRLWLGADFVIDMKLLIGLLLMQGLISYISPFFMVLNGAGVVKKQVYIFTIFAPVALVLKFIAAKTVGSFMVPWVGILCYTVIVIPYVRKISQNIYNKH